MNYKTVSNKKKNTIAIVVALFSLVLLAGTIAGLGFAFVW